jgi:hypothetical protein
MSLADVILRNKTTEEYIRRILVHIDGYQRGLTAQDDWVEKLKIAVTAPLNPIFRRLGRPLTRNKTNKQEEKFFSTDASPDEVEVALTDGGYDRNLISTKKYIIRDDEQIWAVGSYRIVYGEDDRFQHHIYLIPREDGGTDVYGHKETNYEYDPSGHVSDAQGDGDPDNKATPILEEL